MPKRGAFLQPKFILTEGAEDAAISRVLITARGLQSFDVSPTIDLGDIGGNAGFEEAAIRCGPITGFSAVTSIVIVSDNDDDPTAAVKAIHDQIEKARAEGNLTRNWAVPETSSSIALGDPSVAVWTWPAPGKPGCLETLLWEIVLKRHAEDAACIDAACKCAAIDGWPKSKLDKARIRCFISLNHRRNPAIALANLWRDNPALIPLNDPIFNEYSTFLASI